MISRTEYIQCKIQFEGIKDGTKDQAASNRYIVCTVYTTKKEYHKLASENLQRVFRTRCVFDKQKKRFNFSKIA